MINPLVIYHADCTDGFGAAFAAWIKLSDEAEYLPMNYNDTDTHLEYTGRDLYILDFSFPREVMEHMFANAKRVVWLDHHKTAFEMWCGSYQKGDIYLRGGIHEKLDNPEHYIALDDNKSGAMLAWEYFHTDTEVPMLIQHIDDRDRWQWKMDGSAELHAALGAMKPWSFEQWKELLPDAVFGEMETDDLINEGSAILRAQKQHVASMVKRARKCEIWKLTDDNYEGEYLFKLPGLAVNATLHISEVGHELANASGTYGLIYYISADNRVKCSLRSNGDYDVSAIAKAFGGGGHKNAAGFETDIQTLVGWLK